MRLGCLFCLSFCGKCGKITNRVAEYLLIASELSAGGGSLAKRYISRILRIYPQIGRISKVGLDINELCDILAYLIMG